MKIVVAVLRVPAADYLLDYFRLVEFPFFLFVAQDFFTREKSK